MSLLRRLNSPPIGVCIAVVGLLLVTGWQNRQAAPVRAELPMPKTESIAAKPELKVPPVNPDPERAEWRSEQDLQAQWQMVRWAFFAFLTAIVSVCVTIIGLVFVKRTLDANRDAVRAAERAILVENRPWLKFAPKISGDPVSGEWGINFPVDVMLTNVGRGPAKVIGVATGEIDFFEDTPLNVLLEWIAKHVEIAEKHPREQETIFPAEAYNVATVARLSADTIAKRPERDDDGPKMITPIFIFGIFYKAAIKSEIFYTVAAYVCSRPTDRGTSQAIFLDGSKIEGRTLTLTRYSGLNRAM